MSRTRTVGTVSSSPDEQQTPASEAPARPVSSHAIHMPSFDVDLTDRAGTVPAGPEPRVRPGAPDWMMRAAKLGRRFDNSRLSPQRQAKAAHGRLYDRRQRAAAKDPEWAEIEKRRNRRPDGTATLLSEDDGLNWSHFRRQREIERRLVPTPPWMKLLYRLGDISLGDSLTATASAVSRLRRGWDPSDAYNLGCHLPRHVGEQLAWLSQNAHGWPGNQEFPTYDDWVNTLRHHAHLLTTNGYGDGPSHDALLDAWATARDAAEDSTGTETSHADLRSAERLAWQQMQDAEAAAEAAVAASMSWVVSHLPQLWD